MNSATTTTTTTSSSARRNKPLPPYTYAIANTKYDVDRHPHLQNEVLTVPTQRQTERDQIREPIDWPKLLGCSRTLFSLPTSQIRSPSLRRLINYAKQFNSETSVDERFTSSHVVYAIFHSLSNCYYIGETMYNGQRRLAQHWYDRTKRQDVSSLTKFIQRIAHKRQHVWAEFRIIPLRVNITSDSERKQAETDAIAYMKRDKKTSHKCLNYFKPTQPKRLRHHNPPVGKPTGTVSVNRRPVEPAITHVLSAPPANRFAILTAMSLQKVNRILHTVDKAAPIAQTLREVRRDKYNTKKNRNTSDPSFLVTHTTKTLAGANFHTTFKSGTEVWPFEKKFIANARIQYKLNKACGKDFRNHTDASLNLDSCDICECHKFDDKHKWNGHVLTSDATVLTSLIEPKHRAVVDQLISINGANHRFSLGTLKALAALRDDLLAFALRCASQAKPNMKMDERVATVSPWVDVMYDKLARSCSLFDSPNAVPIRKILNDAHRILVIAPMDKAPQNSVIWCKRLYRNTILHHLSEPTFIEAPDVDVFSVHKTIAQQYGKQAHPVFPYMYLLAKVHKLDALRGQEGVLPPSRPIVGKAVTNTVSKEPYKRHGLNSLSEVNRQAAAMLNNVLDLLLLADGQQAIKRCWYTRTVEEFVDTVSQETTLHQISTADFSDMYTKLPHDKLLEYLNEGINLIIPVLARQFRISEFVVIDRIVFTASGKWEHVSSLSNAPKDSWSIDQLRSALKNLISNSYVLMNGKFYLQQIGVGMGHEPCPPIANLFLHICERKWVDRMVHKYGEDEVNRRWNNFRSFCRQMDDLFFPQVPDDAQEDSLPTPDDYCGMEFKYQHKGTYAQFLGLEVRIIPKARGTSEVRFNTLDKQKKYNLHIIRFPSQAATVPRSILTGCIVGTLTRCVTLTSRTDDFIEIAAASLAYMKKHRSYSIDVIQQGLQKFVRNHIRPEHKPTVARQVMERLNSNVIPVPRSSTDPLVDPHPIDRFSLPRPSSPAAPVVNRRYTLRGQPNRSRSAPIVTRSVAARAMNSAVQTDQPSPIPDPAVTTGTASTSSTTVPESHSNQLVDAVRELAQQQSTMLNQVLGKITSPVVHVHNTMQATPVEVRVPAVTPTIPNVVVHPAAVNVNPTFFHAISNRQSHETPVINVHPAAVSVHPTFHHQIDNHAAPLTVQQPAVHVHPSLGQPVFHNNISNTIPTPASVFVNNHYDHHIPSITVPQPSVVVQPIHIESQPVSLNPTFPITVQQPAVHVHPSLEMHPVIENHNYIPPAAVAPVEVNNHIDNHVQSVTVPTPSVVVNPVIENRIPVTPVHVNPQTSVVLQPLNIESPVHIDNHINTRRPRRRPPHDDNDAPNDDHDDSENDSSGSAALQQVVKIVEHIQHIRDQQSDRFERQVLDLKMSMETLTSNMSAQNVNDPIAALTSTLGNVVHQLADRESKYQSLFSAVIGRFNTESERSSSTIERFFHELCQLNTKRDNQICETMSGLGSTYSTIAQTLSQTHTLNSTNADHNLQSLITAVNERVQAIENANTEALNSVSSRLDHFITTVNEQANSAGASSSATSEEINHLATTISALIDQYNDLARSNNDVSRTVRESLEGLPSTIALAATTLKRLHFEAEESTPRLAHGSAVRSMSLRTEAAPCDQQAFQEPREGCAVAAEEEPDPTPQQYVRTSRRAASRSLAPEDEEAPTSSSQSLEKYKASLRTLSESHQVRALMRI